MEMELTLIKARSKEADSLEKIRKEKEKSAKAATKSSKKSEKATTLATGLPESEEEGQSGRSDNEEGESSEDDFAMTSTNVTKVYYGGLFNNAKFLKGLDFTQKSMIVAARAIVNRLETLIERVNNSGGQQFEKFVRDLEEMLDNLKDMKAFVEDSALRRKIKEISEVLLALSHLLGPRNSIGCLQHVNKWLQLSSTKQIIGSEKSENLVFTLNLQSKRNRRLFQVSASELMRWKTRREMSQKGAPHNSNSGQSSRGGHRGGHQGGHRGGYKGGYKGNNHDGRQGGYQGSGSGGKWENNKDSRNDRGYGNGGQSNSLVNK